MHDRAEHHFAFGAPAAVQRAAPDPGTLGDGGDRGARVAALGQQRQDRSADGVVDALLPGSARCRDGVLRRYEIYGTVIDTNITTLQADQIATQLARSASALMIVSAATSAYWAAGGTGLLDTVGGSIARWGRDGGAGVKLTLAAIVVLKLVTAWLPARAVREPCPRAVRRLAWLEAMIFTVYGGVLTGTGLAVQAGVIGAGADADWKALDWHVYLWDPWFLVVGLFVWAALRRTPERRARRTGTPIRPWRATAS